VSVIIPPYIHNTEEIEFLDSEGRTAYHGKTSGKVNREFKTDRDQQQSGMSVRNPGETAELLLLVSFALLVVASFLDVLGPNGVPVSSAIVNGRSVSM
jgi:hypothetical protein